MSICLVLSSIQRMRCIEILACGANMNARAAYRTVVCCTKSPSYFSLIRTFIDDCRSQFQLRFVLQFNNKTIYFRRFEFDETNTADDSLPVVEFSCSTLLQFSLIYYLENLKKTFSHLPFFFFINVYEWGKSVFQQTTTFDYTVRWMY